VNEEQFSAKVDELGSHYMPLMLARLDQLGEILGRHGYDPRPAYDMTDEQYSAWLTVHLPDDDEPVFDVSITLEESRTYGDELDGIAFGLGIVEYGGLIIGDLQPYNYTKSVWVCVDDSDEIARRWSLIDQCDDHEIAALIERHYASKVAP
jgi:hypothetical protein